MVVNKHSLYEQILDLVSYTQHTGIATMPSEFQTAWL